jgi:hypothetical protein
MMLKLFNFLLLLGFITVVSSCDGRGRISLQERISSLRAFGATPVPLVSLPSDDTEPTRTVEVTFYAAVPLGLTATVAPFLDTGSSVGALPLPLSAISVDESSEAYTDHSGYRLFSEKVRLTIPAVSAFNRPIDGVFKGGQIRYGLTVTAGSEHEDMIANINIFPEGAKELDWENPKIEISSPLSGSSFSTASPSELLSSVTNPNSEDVKVGWYVSDGEVSNREAANTSWKLGAAGAKTVAITVHGFNSRGFALHVIDVVGQ